MVVETAFSKDLKLRFPLIVAPMFLVSNAQMIKAAIDNEVMGVFPTLNFRNDGELEKVLTEIKDYDQQNGGKGHYGVNLIVQKSNPLYEKHLKICIEQKVPFYITSLGNPTNVIEAAHQYGGKVFCDVTNLKHAQKVADAGADGFIAVTQGAGGHAGPNPMNILIPALKKRFPNIPVIAAGGIAHGNAITSSLALGAEGVSVGTRFIASNEATVNDAYKNAIVEAGMDDIVMTTKLSGTPSSVINTDEAKKIGLKQNFLERWLSKNKTTKKYFKMWVQYLGMKKLEKSVAANNYKRIWSAGKSVHMIEDISPMSKIIDRLEDETIESIRETTNLLKEK